MLLTLSSEFSITDLDEQQPAANISSLGLAFISDCSAVARVARVKKLPSAFLPLAMVRGIPSPAAWLVLKAS